MCPSTQTGGQHFIARLLCPALFLRGHERSCRPLTQNGTTDCKRSRRAKIFEVERAGSLHAFLLPETEKRQREDLPLTHSRIVFCRIPAVFSLYCTKHSLIGPRPPLFAPRDDSNVWQLMRSLCGRLCLSQAGVLRRFLALALSDHSADRRICQVTSGRLNGTPGRGRGSPDRT